MNTIEQHMQLSKQQRQAHIDTNTKCYGHVIKQGKNKGHSSRQAKYAKMSLLDFHQIEDFDGMKIKIHTCHLCPNNKDFICINPNHLYFGTVSENQFDKPEHVRKEAAKKGAKEGGKKVCAKNARKAMKNGNHISQQLHTCPVCGFEGKGAIMKRWHFDNCKHKK